MGTPSILLGHWHRATLEPAGRAAVDPAGRAPVGPAGSGSPAAPPELPPDQSFDDPPFATHLHGRDLVVVHEASPPHWHWRVTSPHGVVLAEGDAPSRDAAEQAAEDEATAVHPPTDTLMDRLLS